MTAGGATRVATFCLLLVAGLVALLFAMRLTAAAFSCDFSPFAFVPASDDHALWAWLLVAGLVLLSVLVWLVLRHGDDMLWLAGEDGGVLLGAAELQAAAEAAACASHPDVLGVETAFAVRRGVLGASVRARARPLADAGLVRDAVDGAVRRRVTARTGHDLGRLVVRVRVVTVPQLKRHLP